MNGMENSNLLLEHMHASKFLLALSWLHTFFPTLLVQCTRKGALSTFFTHLFEPPEEIAVIGAGCSVASEAVAEIVDYYNLTMVETKVIAYQYVCIPIYQ